MKARPLLAAIGAPAPARAHALRQSRSPGRPRFAGRARAPRRRRRADRGRLRDDAGLRRGRSGSTRTWTGSWARRPDRASRSTRPAWSCWPLKRSARPSPTACSACTGRPGGRSGADRIRPCQLAPASSTRKARGIALVALPIGVEADLRAFAPWLLGGVKSTSYAMNMAAEAEAGAEGADDAVFLAQGDIVLEGPVTNVWWRRERVLHARARLRILAGVTRLTLAEEAAGLEYELREGAFAGAPRRVGGSLHVVVDPGGRPGRRARRQTARRRQAWTGRE